MNYYFVSEVTERVLDVLYCPAREATATEIEAAARPLANQSGYPVFVIKGEWTGLVFEPSLGHGRDAR